jgi:RimJ/RimL family protein N-acetyltransferase
LLQGKTVNLRILEREDLDFIGEHTNDINCMGEYWSDFEQRSKSDWVKVFESLQSRTDDLKIFIIQKKDGTRIGEIHHFLDRPHMLMEIACWLVASESKKGYATEATQLMVDYLFLSKQLARIQAIVDVRHLASQRVLEKAGFQREGTMRDETFDRGAWRDFYLYSILRREWKEPKILTRAEKK